MTKKSRIAALMLAALLAFSLIFSCLVIVGEADHDCSGADCEICLVVSACVNFLRGAIPCALVLSFGLFSAFGKSAPLLLRSVLRAGTTPVILKVKLSN